jgi:AraC-like DNA-binding protein
VALFQNLFENNHYSFKQIIHEHLYEELSSSELAVLCGMSLSSFKRKFKEVFDESPKQYINHKRIEKAQELLHHSELNISEVAYKIGFNDIGYFSKVFKSKVGVPPSEYRLIRN